MVIEPEWKIECEIGDGSEKIYWNNRGWSFANGETIVIAGEIHDWIVYNIWVMKIDGLIFYMDCSRSCIVSIELTRGLECFVSGRLKWGQIFVRLMRTFHWSPVYDISWLFYHAWMGFFYFLSFFKSTIFSLAGTAIDDRDSILVNFLRQSVFTIRDTSSTRKSFCDFYQHASRVRDRVYMVGCWD